MKKIIARIIITISIINIAISINAGQYIKIENIDDVTHYPRISIIISINNPIDCTRPLLYNENIRIIEDEKPVRGSIKITSLNDAVNYLYLVFSIDSSKSISKKFLASIKSSAHTIVQSIGPKDKIAVYRFNDHVQLLNDFTRDTPTIINGINSIERHGKKTLLYNSIYDSIELFDKIKERNKKIIVFTDGKDEGSSINDDDIIEFARNAGIPIYFICFHNSPNMRILAQISKMTGGKLIYSKDHAAAAGMYQTILSVMKNRYNIEYITHQRKKGSTHKYEIRLKYDDIRDRDIEYIHKEHDFDIKNSFYDNTILIAIIFGLCIIVFCIIIYFINREKRLLKEQFDNEKKIFLKRNEVASSYNLVETYPELIPLIPSDPAIIPVSAWVYKKDGPESGKKFLLQKEEITIGSAKESTIVIKENSISPQHAKIKNINGDYHLFDLISNIGTYLNGKKLLRPKMLYDWDEITIGRTTLIFRGNQHPH